MANNRITFIEKDHIYLLNDTYVIPSVTQILSFIFPDKYKGIPEHILKNKSQYGTKIHEAIEKFESEGIIEKLDYIQEASFNQYLRLKKEHKIEVIDQEQIIHYKDIYCGRYDMSANVNGEYSLIDIKTTAELDLEYLSYQLSLYDYPNKKRHDKLMALYQTRMQAAKLQGKESNIFDLYDGKDLILTITRDSTGGNVINITDADEKSPLTTDTALGAKWINDPKKWNEVYTFKNFEYMEILVQGGIPYWSSELGKYVDKAEYEKSVEASRETAFNQNYTEPKVDYSKIQAEVAQPLPKAVTVTTDENVDDLPF